MEKSIIIAIGSGLVLGLGLLYVHQKMTEKEEVTSSASGWNDGNIVQKYQRPHWVVG